MAGGPGEEVVREVLGEHAGIGVGEDELVLDRLEQQPPLAAAFLVADLKRGQRQRGGAAAELGERAVARLEALVQDAALLNADTDVDQGEGKTLERYLSWLATSCPRPGQDTAWHGGAGPRGTGRSIGPVRSAGAFKPSRSTMMRSMFVSLRCPDSSIDRKAWLRPVRSAMSS